MRRTVPLLVLVALVVASCVPRSEDVTGPIPYLDAPSPMTTADDTIEYRAAPADESGQTSDDRSPGLGDLAALGDGRLAVVADGGVALFGPSSGWEVLDLTGLPEGNPDGRGMARMVGAVAVGPDDSLWVAGHSTSSADDVEFGGVVNDWVGGRILDWIARRDCVVGDCTWTVFTSNEQPALAGGVGDLAIDADGTLFASVGSDRLVTFDGSTWDWYHVSGVPGETWPWSGSLAVDAEGTLFAAVNGDERGADGVLSFDGDDFVRLAFQWPEWGPGEWVRQVAVGSDGSLWAVTDRMGADSKLERPDVATGVLRFDGTSWTAYTIDDGLLSNDALIATGADGTVWAIHGAFPPTGFSRFDGTTWTAYPSDRVGGGYWSAVTADGTLWWVNEDGPLMSFDGVATASYRSPFDVFRFGRDDLCEWFSGEEISALVAEHVDWRGSIERSALLNDYGGCRWVLKSDTEDGWLDVGDASEWESFAGGPYEFDDLDVTPYEGVLADIGSVVVNHPALSPGVVVHSGGWGMFAFGRPPGPYLSVSMQVPEAGAWDRTYETGFFSLADALLRRLGWIDGAPVQWGITLDDFGAGVHTVRMVVDFGAVARVDVTFVSGRLVWTETEVGLCAIAVRGAGSGILHVGDIFQTTEGCGDDPTAMQDAFDEYGLPETACVSATIHGVRHEYCHPLREPTGTSRSGDR